jgi:hypothetical protein
MIKVSGTLTVKPLGRNILGMVQISAPEFQPSAPESRLLLHAKAQVHSRASAGSSRLPVLQFRHFEELLL